MGDRLTMSNVEIEAEQDIVDALLYAETEKLIYGEATLEHDINNNMIRVHSPSGIKEFKYSLDNVVLKMIKAYKETCDEM